jgi:hypothetical protein
MRGRLHTCTSARTTQSYLLYRTNHIIHYGSDLLVAQLGVSAFSRHRSDAIKRAAVKHL